jgi:acyl-CoA synthetase (AMP-forming)/AMP-acid ligase II
MITTTIVDAIWTKDRKTVIGDNKESICCKIIFPYPDGGDFFSPENAYELTYAGARRACQDHRDWFLQILSSTQPQSTASITRVYYLSNNSVDFFLSVLACFYDCDNDESQSMPRVLPVLLNSRWTVAEIVPVLQQTQLDDYSASYILYGNGLDPVAKQVVAQIRGKDGMSFIACHPIPNCSMKYWRRVEQMQPLIDRRNDSTIQSSPATDGVECPAALCHDDAIIVYTSGTSGKPKGVRLSHRAIVVQCHAKCQLLRYDTQTHVFANLPPFFHVGGLSSILAVWMARGTLVFCQPPPSFSRTNPSTTAMDGSSWTLWQSLPWVNTLVVVPAMLHILQQQIYNNNHSHNRHQGPSIHPPFPHMRLILIGGQSASPLQLEFVRSIFPCTRIVQTYACTEAASSLTFFDVTTAATDPSPSSSLSPQQQGKDGKLSIVPTATNTFDCVGYPPSHIELAIFQKEKNPTKTTKDDGDGGDEGCDGTIIHKPYVHGILATRGPHMMNGYWGETSSFAPQDDSKKFTHTLFHTNDIGFRDPDGRFYLVGRLTDSIRTGGETVHATEVEKILLQHPDVAEVAVFGIPNDRLGEMICCAVIPSTWTMTKNELNQQPPTRPPTSLSLENVRSWCTKHGLARYKHPRRILYMNALPRNTSGKVVKTQLTEHFLPKWSKL